MSAKQHITYIHEYYHLITPRIHIHESAVKQGWVWIHLYYPDNMPDLLKQGETDDIDLYYARM